MVKYNALWITKDWLFFAVYLYLYSSFPDAWVHSLFLSFFLFLPVLDDVTIPWWLLDSGKKCVLEKKKRSLNGTLLMTLIQTLPGFSVLSSLFRYFVSALCYIPIPSLAQPCFHSTHSINHSFTHSDNHNKCLTSILVFI